MLGNESWYFTMPPLSVRRWQHAQIFGKLLCSLQHLYRGTAGLVLSATVDHSITEASQTSAARRLRSSARSSVPSRAHLHAISRPATAQNLPGLEIGKEVIFAALRR